MFIQEQLSKNKLSGVCQLTDWLPHIPMEALAKNFQTDISAFAHIPSHELYIFPAGKFGRTEWLFVYLQCSYPERRTLGRCYTSN